MLRVIFIITTMIFTAIPALADTPQISLGATVMMQVDSAYKKRQQEGKESSLYFGDRPARKNEEFLMFDDHTQLLTYFDGLPSHMKNNGLWIKRFARHLWTQPDEERIDLLTEAARLRKLLLFVCEPKEGKYGSWLVSWQCEQVSPPKGDLSLRCGASESPEKPTEWSCMDASIYETSSLHCLVLDLGLKQGAAICMACMG